MVNYYISYLNNKFQSSYNLSKLNKHLLQYVVIGKNVVLSNVLFILFLYFAITLEK